MNNLTVVNNEEVEKFTIDSREVAKMVDRNHADVMRDIRNVISHIEGQSKSAESLFEESTYVNSQNKVQPCYLLTKMGCELFATRMNGEKGTLFALSYIERFNEMERALYVAPKELSFAEQMVMFYQSQVEMEKKQKEAEIKLIEQEKEIKEVKQKVDNIHEAFEMNMDNWREVSTKIINKIANKRGLSIPEVRAESYKRLENEMVCKLDSRLSNLKSRLLEAGNTNTVAKSKTKLDVIEQDRKLLNCYKTVIQKMSVSYNVGIDLI